MATLNPYLNFNGNAEDAFNFYKSVFGGEFITLQRFKDTPEADRVPPADKDKIMHIALPIGKGNILMATDAVESMGHKLVEGNNFMLSIGADSEKEADKLFNGLSTGGKVEVPMSKMFWGAYFGMFKDKFGIKWMINYDYPK
jgi:PhnB protein